MLAESIKKEFTEHVPCKSFERWAENVRTYSEKHDGQRHESMKEHM